VNEEVSRDMTGEADGKNQGVYSRDGVIVDSSSRSRGTPNSKLFFYPLSTVLRRKAKAQAK